MRNPWPRARPAGARRRREPATLRTAAGARHGAHPATVRAAAGAAAAGWLLAACAGAGPPASTVTAAPATSPAARPATPAATPAPARKLLVIMEENHSAGEVFPSGMPYLWHLARRYGYAADWDAIGHPSLPNYLAIFAGSAFNYPPDCSPGSGCSYPGPSVFGQALARGETRPRVRGVHAAAV